MKTRDLRVLVLNGYLADPASIQAELNGLEEPVRMRLIQSRADLESELETFAPDVIVADHPLVREDPAHVAELATLVRYAVQMELVKPQH